MCEISSKVNIKVTVLVSLLLNPNMFINFTHFSIFSIADFEQVTDCWVDMVCMSQGTEHIAHNNFCSSLMAYCKQNQVLESIPADMYLLIVNNRNTRTRCEICSELYIQQCSLLLTLNIFHTLF